MKLLFVGGGTLGPVTPLLAVWELLSARSRGEHTAVWVGTSDGPEGQLVRAANIPFLHLHAAKWDRYFSLRNFFAPFVFMRSLFAAWQMLRAEKPDVVVSAGAYLALPIGIVAAWMHIPHVGHQSDVRAGVTNLALAKRFSTLTLGVAQTAQAFPDINTVVTGVPVRPTIVQALTERTEKTALAHQRFGLDDGIRTVFIIGGGTGSAQMNAMVAQVINELVEAVQIIHLTGEGKSGATINHPRYHPFAFFQEEDLLLAYAAADFVVSRAGMGAIAELAVLQKPCALFPYPNSPQEDNARWCNTRAGIPIFEGKTTAKDFAGEIIRYTTNPQSYPGSIEQFRSLIPSTAAQQMVEVIMRAPFSA